MGPSFTRYEIFQCRMTKIYFLAEIHNQLIKKEPIAFRLVNVRFACITVLGKSIKF